MNALSGERWPMQAVCQVISDRLAWISTPNIDLTDGLFMLELRTHAQGVILPPGHLYL